MTELLFLRAHDRDHAAYDWLDSRRSWPDRAMEEVGVRGTPLCAIVEDTVVAGAGFGLHPHQDMEILTYVIGGAIVHEDTMGNRETLGPGQVQHMSAGRGIHHSEWNGSRTDPLHFLQIWIRPANRGGSPGYDRIAFDPAAPLVRLCDGASAPGCIRIGQDAAIWRAAPGAGQSVGVPSEGRRLAWVQGVRGSMEIDGRRLGPGDGLAVEISAGLELTAHEPNSEALVFLQRLNASAPAVAAQNGLRSDGIRSPL